jgi:hypothetical protein
VMETEVSGQIGAAPYERSTERTAYRNGYRTRRWDTRVGTIEQIVRDAAGDREVEELAPVEAPPTTAGLSRTVHYEGKRTG